MAAVDEDLDVWKHFKPKYEVHQEAYTFYNRISSLGCNRLPFEFKNIQEARENDTLVCTKLAGHFDFNGSTLEFKIPLLLQDDQCICAQVYQPNSMLENPPIWVYFHGGGLVMGCCENYKKALQIIAWKSGAVVVSVEYRLLPLPEKCAPIHDGIAATKWVMQNKTKVGGSEQSKIGIGGDSSGGYIAACVTNELTNLDFQILIYPFIDPSRTQQSLSEFADDPVIPRSMLDWSFDLTIRQMPNYLTDPKLNPAINDIDIHRCPPALVLLAELDPFRDGGIEYAEKLRKAGVDVNAIILKGIPHFFFNFPDIFESTCENAYGEIASFIRRFSL